MPLSNERIEIRDSCKSSLFAYAQWCFPDRYYGDLHREMFDFIQYGPPNKEDSRKRLLLVPRDHQKSHVIAVAASWHITREPCSTINYVSANDDLVLAQIMVIKSVLKSPQHRALWPNMLNYVSTRGVNKHKPVEENVWQQWQFMVDHPDRKDKGVRDPTVRGATVKSGSTGMHSTITIFDDLVTDENYASETSRADVIKCYKSFAKINTTGSLMFAVGTRYGPHDLYNTLIEQMVEIGDELFPAWDVFERVVEDSVSRTGDGNFVWPRMQLADGQWHGFDIRELAEKKADCLIDGDASNFYAQYYNDPNHDGLADIKRDNFKYFEERDLRKDNGQWYYQDKPLKLTAAADLAWTDSTHKMAKRRDFTALVVLGVDSEGYYYVLDLQRFQTDKPEVYYKKIIELHEYWEFRKIVIETNSAGKFVKHYIETQVRLSGSYLSVEGKTHVSHEGRKQERIDQVLLPRYRNGDIFHKKGGLTRTLEEELTNVRPPHDDLKDVLAISIAESKPPLKLSTSKKYKKSRPSRTSRNAYGPTRRRRR